MTTGRGQTGLGQKGLGLPAAVLAAVLAASNAARAEGLADWVGRWEGTCRVTSTQGKLSSVATSLEIRKLAADGSLHSWIVTYGPGTDAAQRRAYEIAAVNAVHGHYVIDEKNGLEIDAWLVANQIFAPFEIAGNLIVAKYIRMKGGIVMELPSFATDKRRRTCLESNRSTCAHSYRMTGVQLCFLRPAK
ncbi:MAG: hypothetical protein RLT05_27860 [Bauldia litoralis]